MVTVMAVNSGASRNKWIQTCLCKICWLTARANCMVKAVHIKGVTNRINDCLLRWDLQIYYNSNSIT